MLIKDTEEWANNLFSSAKLGDKRRTKRLVKLSHLMASNTGSSIVKASGTQAAIEGSYRFIRNDAIEADDIATAGFSSLLSELKSSKNILALEDTSTLSYRHNVTKELGFTGASKKCKAKGMLAHSVLMVDAQTEHTIGLAEQHRWCRKDEDFGTKHQRKQREYKTKESYKWQRSSEAMTARYASVMDNIISVCDRESDIFDYIAYKEKHQQRFVVRAKHERIVTGDGDKLTPYINQQSSELSYQVKIQQKGGRKARIANVAVRFASVTISPPKKQAMCDDIKLTLISCNEISPPEGAKALCWKLYTNEAVNCAADALKTVRYYELRWRVEEYHKAWKSAGTQVESFRLQTRQNLEKIIVITAFIAVRLLQLRELSGNKEKAKSTSCEGYFAPLEWKLMWSKTEAKALPKKPPTLYWAYYALAKLGRWHDSKRTGVVGWEALWDGWFTLNQLLEGARFMQQQME
ncbi:MAG: IS4 family transposase [Enterobacterales bacterium]|nr:IS4 family transposase [Enterobacterales bacterium]